MIEFVVSQQPRVSLRIENKADRQAGVRLRWGGRQYALGWGGFVRRCDYTMAIPMGK